ncbi:O-antigen ligase family protein [Mycolicibacterium sp. CBM1]
MTGSIRATPAPGEAAVMAIVAGAAAIAAIAMFGPRSPLLLVAATIGGAGLVFAARRPVVALVLIVAIELSNLSGVLEQHGSVPVFQASMLLGLLSIGLALRNPELRARLNAWTVLCAGLAAFFLATQVIAAVGSVDVAVSLAAVRRTAIDLVFLLIVLVLTQLTARPWLVATTVVVVLVVLSLLTVINQVVFAGTASFGGFSIVTTSSGELVTTLRYGGPLPDSNFWGRHLTMGLPLAAALLTRALRSSRRGMASACGLSIVALLAGIYLTQSRGTFLSAGVAMALWFIVAERSVRRWGLVSLPLAGALLLVPGVGNRLQQMFRDISTGQANTHIDPSLLGRLAAQEQAVLMWEERPVFGFGPGTFPGQVFHFAGRVATAVREAPDGAHNIYLSLAAESGILGLLGWATMVVGFLAVFFMRISVDPRSRDRVLVAALIAAAIGWSVASAVLHMAYFRTFAVVLGMAAAMAPAWPVPAQIARTVVRGLAVWSSAVAVGVAMFVTSLTVSGSSAVEATQRMTLVPAAPIDGYYAYALDIRSRGEVLPTFAVMLREGNSPVTIEADPVRGLLNFSVKADTSEQARDALQLAVARAANRMSQSIGFNQYLLQRIGSMEITPVRDRSTVVAAGSVAAVAALAMAAVSASALRRRRYDGDDEPATAPLQVANVAG